MSAIAAVLRWMGHHVTGSDLKESPSTERLRALGIEVTIGHAAENVGSAEVLTISTAIPPSNPEVRLATDLGLPVLRRADALRAISMERRTVAVAGTHGKTTTSSMLALICVEAGLRPSFIIGGDVNEIGSGAAWDEGDWFIVEADESDGTFLALPRVAAIVTNVEPDHLEHWGGVAALEAAFGDFAASTVGPVVCCADDPGAAALAATIETAITYGTLAGADIRIEDLRRHGDATEFELVDRGRSLGRFTVPIPGVHNALNAAAAAAMALTLGADVDAIRRALARFGGVARRFERRGQEAGVTFIDDYAHLPSEVRAALAAARDGEWKRVVCVFQPHRYSRTQALWRDFDQAFVDADLVVVTDVYASNEMPRPGVSGKLIVDAVLDGDPWKRVGWFRHREELVDFLFGELRPGDLCLTLGAGDLTTLPDALMARLRDAA